jgi:hypothetical protein
MELVTASDVRVRRCSVCRHVFETPRGQGRPPEKCSQACRKKAHSQHQHDYMRRLIDARRQLTAAQAA